MSFPVGNIWDYVLEVTRLQSDDYVRIVKDITVEAYYELCRITSWSDLRTTVDIDFSDMSGTAGMWLPADMLGVDAVWDTGDTEIEYVGTDEMALEILDPTYRWFFSETNYTPLFEDDGANATGVNITVGSATISWESSSPGSTIVNEFISFGKIPGIYKLSAETTLAFPFRFHEDQSGSSYQIRPEGTKRLLCHSPSHTVVDNRTVRLHYWKLPPPPFSDMDRVFLPSARVLQLLTLIRYMGTVHRREQSADRYRVELYGPRQEGGGELDKAISMNPTFGKHTGPRDKRARQIFQRSEGRSLYKSKAS